MIWPFNFKRASSCTNFTEIKFTSNIITGRGSSLYYYMRTWSQKIQRNKWKLRHIGKLSTSFWNPSTQSIQRGKKHQTWMKKKFYSTLWNLLGKRVSCFNNGYTSITCSKIEHIASNLIFTTAFNDSLILIRLFHGNISICHWQMNMFVRSQYHSGL